MKTDLPLEIVEIIDDEAEALGDHPPEPAHHIPVVSSRWFGPAVAVVLLAVGGTAVIRSSIGSNASTPPTPGLIKPQYFIADPPPGFAMYTAETGSNTAGVDTTSQAEVWATADATATTGSWFVVSQGPQHATGRNSYRTIVDGIEVVFEHDPPTGQTRLSFTKDGVDMAITSFGWIDRQLVRLVKSVNIDDSVIRFSDGFFTSDHRRVLQSDPAAAMFGLPAAEVGYTTGLPTELAEHFTITVAGDNVEDAGRVASFALTNTSSFEVGIRTAVIGQWSADPTITVAQWHDGDRLITLQGNLGASRLQALAQTVHESSSADVQEKLTSTDPAQLPAMQAHASTVVSGMLKDGRGWDIEVSQRTPGDAKAGYLWWIGQPGDEAKPSETRPSDPGDAPQIDTYVEHGRTYILASIPRSMDGAELHVAPTGLPSIVTRLRDVDASLPGEFAASVFLQPVPFTARIIDSNGATVAFWPTFGHG